MAIPWFSEAIDQKPDPVSGARIIQLTSSAVISTYGLDSQAGKAVVAYSTELDVRLRTQI